MDLGATWVLLGLILTESSSYPVSVLVCGIFFSCVFCVLTGLNIEKNSRENATSLLGLVEFGLRFGLFGLSFLFACMYLCVCKPDCSTEHRAEGGGVGGINSRFFLNGHWDINLPWRIFELCKHLNCFLAMLQLKLEEVICMYRERGRAESKRSWKLFALPLFKLKID